MKNPFRKKKQGESIELTLQRLITDLLKDPNSPLMYSYPQIIKDDKGQIIKTTKETKNAFEWNTILLIEINSALREIKELLKKNG